MRFRSVVRLGGKTATGIPVPEEVVEDLGRGKRPPVRVTINGHAYRSTVALVGGEFMLPLSAENREGAGVVAGDEVDVDIELDLEPREVNGEDAQGQTPEGPRGKGHGRPLAAVRVQRQRFPRRLRGGRGEDARC